MQAAGIHRTEVHVSAPLDQLVKALVFEDRVRFARTLFVRKCSELKEFPLFRTHGSRLSFAVVLFNLRR